MADKSDDVGGCLVTLAGFGLFVWLITAPASDQVCRQHKIPILDGWYGIDGQPTCQQLLDQLDAQAAEARRRESDLEDRISEVESKLNM